MKTKLALLISTLTILAFAGDFIIRRQAVKENTEKQTTLLSLPNGYDKAWEKMDSLIAKGLSKSALDEVTDIYNKAKAENNAPQFVKAVMYKMRLAKRLYGGFI